MKRDIDQNYLGILMLVLGKCEDVCFTSGISCVVGMLGNIFF